MERTRTVRSKSPSRSRNQQDSSKLRSINQAIAENDLEKLRTLAGTRRGFINDGVRRRAWMMLLQVDVERLGHTNNAGLLPTPTLFVRRHSESRQIEVDVERSFISFPSGICSPNKITALYSECIVSYKLYIL